MVQDLLWTTCLESAFSDKSDDAKTVAQGQVDLVMAKLCNISSIHSSITYLKPPGARNLGSWDRLHPIHGAKYSHIPFLLYIFEAHSFTMGPCYRYLLVGPLQQPGSPSTGTLNPGQSNSNCLSAGLPQCGRQQQRLKGSLRHMSHGQNSISGESVGVVWDPSQRAAKLYVRSCCHGFWVAEGAL